MGRNAYIWLGTSKVYDSFTFPFVTTAHGRVWAHAYGIGADMSTFIVECGPETWTGLGFDSMSPAETLTTLQSLFAEQLDGAPLVGQALNRGSVRWLNFRTITNARWHDGNVVLVGDAAHTTHFTIGSGTKLAVHGRDGGPAFAITGAHGPTALLPSLREAPRITGRGAAAR